MIILQIIMVFGISFMISKPSRLFTYGKSVEFASNRAFQPVTLVTFDVDGTLIHGSSAKAESSAHARAFCHAIGKVFNNCNDFEKTISSPIKVIPSEKYHGSTDGLISINLAYYSLGIDPQQSFVKLPAIYKAMADYFSSYSDDECVEGIEPLPGVLECLNNLGQSSARMNECVLCGLVTGNVEGIARKKMRACKILDTKCLSPKSDEQTWPTEIDSAFLGGFGSDFCSGEIWNKERYYKDRGEQIAIAFRRANQLIQRNNVATLDNNNRNNNEDLIEKNKKIVRVVHVGDAPSDVLAAKWCAESRLLGEDVTVGCIAVATGKFSFEELEVLCGQEIPGVWEPVVLRKGLADPDFIKFCKIVE